jgi:DNA polymerase-4
VGVHGLADWIQDDLFTDGEESSGVDIVEPLDIREDPPPPLPPPSWPPGADVEHDVHGPGWVWGSGRAGVTVRFETRQSPAGPIHTFAVDDPHLRHRVVELPITSEHE